MFNWQSSNSYIIVGNGTQILLKRSGTTHLSNSHPYFLLKNGQFERYKARLVANDKGQKISIDYL